MGRKKIQITRIMDERNRQVLNKKEQRGCDSSDPETSYILTPHTEEKYQKINEEFDNMMRNHKIPVALGQQSSSMPLTLPVTNPTPLSYSTDSLLDIPACLSGASILSLQSSDCTGVMDGLPSSSDVTLPNGVNSSHVANGIIGGSEGSRMGRVISVKSQALSTVGRKPDLTVLIPPVCQDIVSSLRINNSQSCQSLTTPVVSIATPSLPPQGLVYSAMTSSFSTDYELNSPGSPLHSFSSPEGITSGPSWQHRKHGQPGFSNQRATQAYDPSCSSISIKSEPISPPREHAAQSIYPPIHTMSAPNSKHEVGHSPAESFSSSGSSYECSDREDQRLDSQSVTATPGQGSKTSPGTVDQDNPSVKRMRTDSCVT
ncbi:myocyte-specific enhancer factor 2A isoform X2 [Xyrauchen texanus]|uniref:myocyte-specific enhancer factor 2A isoform X2 n=1 Tax=Xyrauchen texanus TaxID=154827 RepID=UPI002241CF1E|nr:myocyte-specific enhancer factor 2A isoform X2 [Xyrauchen texanus]